MGKLMPIPAGDITATLATPIGGVTLTGISASARGACGHRDGVNINNLFLSRRSSRRATGSRAAYSAPIEGGRCEGLNPALVLPKSPWRGFLFSERGRLLT